MLSQEKKVPQWDKKKNARDRKRVKFLKKKQIDGTLEIRKTEQDIKVLDDGIIFESNDDNIQPLVVLI